MHQPKIVLVIMDGWGYSPIKEGNAIYQANTPTFDFLWNNYSHTLLNSFGENVGLPWGNIGSSEVGHTSIGSGKLIIQELLKVEQSMKSGDFNKNEQILDFIKTSKDNGQPIHLIGLVSNGGVHSHIDHLYAILDLLVIEKFPHEIFIHMITDGRDTSPKSAMLFAEQLERKIRSYKNLNISISTLAGRYYAMDRDNRWDRIREYYLAITQGTSTKADNLKKAIEESYKNDITDEFIKPINLDLSKRTKNLFNLFGKSKKDISDGLIHENDNLFFFNIRPDRMREILEVFLFDKAEIGTKTTKTNILTMITYNEFFDVKVAFPTEKIENPLAKILSNAGLSQGHFAETEKYAHVTYFFNGGNPTPYPGEIWEMVPSPDVTTYDLKPEMSADELTNRVFQLTEKNKLDFVLINYANCDMVGHTGIYDKVISAVETVDRQLKKLIETYPESIIIIGADHGNAECMVHPKTGEIDKKHTVNPVPLVIVGNDFKIAPTEFENLQPTGILADITPTILEILQIPKSPEMNGISFLSSFRTALNKTTS